MRIKAAEFEAQLDVNDPDYVEKLKQCEKLKQMLDESERINEIDFGENKPRNMSREEMYNYYVEHFREDDMKQDAHAEAAVTMEEINKANEDLVKVINKLKANLVKMEENLVNDGSEKYKRDLQDIKDTKEKISILEGRLMDDQE